MRYVGYTGEYDEWRKMDELVTVDQYEEEDDSNLVLSPAAVKFCLFEELASRIKSLSFSGRKANPICSIVLSFDSLHFDSLIVRGTRKETKGSREIYSLTSLTKLCPQPSGLWPLGFGHTYQANPLCPCYNYYMYIDSL